jgi:hypothetical protein
MLIMHT